MERMEGGEEEKQQGWVRPDELLPQLSWYCRCGYDCPTRQCSWSTASDWHVGGQWGYDVILFRSRNVVRSHPSSVPRRRMRATILEEAGNFRGVIEDKRPFPSFALNDILMNFLDCLLISYYSRLFPCLCLHSLYLSCFLSFCCFPMAPVLMSRNLVWNQYLLHCNHFGGSWFTVGWTCFLPAMTALFIISLCRSSKVFAGNNVKGVKSESGAGSYIRLAEIHDKAPLSTRMVATFSPLYHLTGPAPTQRQGERSIPYKAIQ